MKVQPLYYGYSTFYCVIVLVGSTGLKRKFVIYHLFIYLSFYLSLQDGDGEFAYVWQDDAMQVVYHTATLMPNR